MSDKYDVIILGCGPTGLTCGLLLARAGHRVVMIDRHRSIYPLPRAIAYDHEVARILNSLGLTQAMEPLVAKPGVYQWRSGSGELLFELNWAESSSISGFAVSYLFSQPELESVLNAAAEASANLTIVRGVEAAELAFGDSIVTVTGYDDAGAPRTFSGHWLVGADGANSLVRRSMGVEFDDMGFRADWLVVDVKARDSGKLPLDDDMMLQVCDPGRPTTVVSGGPGRRRWEFMALEGETLDELNSSDRAWQLLAPWNIDASNAVLERHAVYTFRGAVAPVWRKGRAFLAGDAAHLTPPFAGQGLCAGFRDAAALAWRLDLALRGLASESLLDSYESERKAHARAWVVNAIELGKVICVLDPQEAAARDEALLAARMAGAPPPSSAILPTLGSGASLPAHHGGRLAAGGQVRRAGLDGHLDDVVGRGFVLMSRIGDPISMLSSETADAFAAAGGVAACLAPLGDIDDINGTFARWFDDLDADIALIRPDYYLFGAARGEAAAEMFVKSMLELLHTG